MAGKGYLWCLFLKMDQRHLPDDKIVGWISVHYFRMFFEGEGAYRHRGEQQMR